jgi:hypothetical protein
MEVIFGQLSCPASHETPRIFVESKVQYRPHMTPTTGPYPVQDESNPHCHITALYEPFQYHPSRYNLVS